MINDKQIDFEKIFSIAPSWTSSVERLKLSQLAKEVPEKGLILEIGALYGGVTAVMSLSNPLAKIYVIDNFSWTPDGYPVASKQRLLDNLKSLDVTNTIFVKDMTSREGSKKWDKQIDLLWIDGGHSFDFVYFDLMHYSQFAKVIALHDYDNEFWPDIRNAVERFIGLNPTWYIDTVIDMVVVLRKKESE